MLTEKQRAFCEHYVASLNATDAARRAGYRKPSEQGYENLRKPQIQKHIDEVLGALSAERVATAQEVLEYLTSVARGEEAEEVVSVTDAGVARCERRVATRDRIRAAELLGRRHALFTDRSLVEARVDPTGLLDEIARQIG
ncbi:MAG: terminase small subunit [Coriobacteriales bacterium]|jgi:phage terminase small subunit|nr:terminase small subunit [Coriobacteriales bacterium]